MAENQRRSIEGYRDLNPSEIATINEIKYLEKRLGDLWKTIGEAPGVDRRWHAMARTHFEQGAMALIRSVARPVDNFSA
jgi:hypothetical protein